MTKHELLAVLDREIEQLRYSDHDTGAVPALQTIQQILEKLIDG
jgi:hypothetical protein